MTSGKRLIVFKKTPLSNTYISGELDNDTEFYLPNSTYIGGDKDKLTLREIKQRLEVGHHCLSLTTELSLIIQIYMLKL